MARKTIEVLWQLDKEEPNRQKGEKIRVAAYCRLSRQSGDKRINSLDNQLKYYTHYIRSHDEYKLVGLYYDGEISGATIDNRPGFRRLLRHCDEGLIDLVLTKSISRFSRNAKDILEVVDHLSDLGIPVIFEKENINSLERKNKFFLTALTAVSQDEIVNIAHNSTWGKNKRILSGNPIYRRQFGYEIIKDGDESFPLIHQEESDIIKAVLNRFRFSKGCDIHIHSDLPAGSGMGTSSSLTVALIAVFLKIKAAASRAPSCPASPARPNPAAWPPPWPGPWRNCWLSWWPWPINLINRVG